MHGGARFIRLPVHPPHDHQQVKGSLHAWKKRAVSADLTLTTPLSLPAVTRHCGQVSPNDYLLGLEPSSLGLVVIDVDKGDKADACYQLENKLGVPLLTTTTYSDGRHLYYYYTSERLVSNKRWEWSGFSGDLRGTRGYVVLYDMVGLATALAKQEREDAVGLTPEKMAFLCPPPRANNLGSRFTDIERGYTLEKGSFPTEGRHEYLKGLLGYYRATTDQQGFDWACQQALPLFLSVKPESEREFEDLVRWTIDNIPMGSSRPQLSLSDPDSPMEATAEKPPAPCYRLRDQAVRSGNFEPFPSGWGHWNTKLQQWDLLGDKPSVLTEVAIRNYPLADMDIRSKPSEAARVGSLLDARLMVEHTMNKTPLRSSLRHLWAWSNGQVFDHLLGKERPMEKTDYLTGRLDYIGDLNEQIVPELLVEVILSAFRGGIESTENFLDLMAHILFDDNKFQKFFLLYGRSGSGKGTLVRLLQTLMGTKETFTLNAQAVRDGKEHALLPVAGKRAVFVEEASYGIPHNVTKQLTGGDTLSVRPLYKAAVEITYTGHLIFTSQEPITNMDTGMHRRHFPIQFLSPPETAPDPDLGNKLSKLRPQIFGSLYQRWLASIRDWTELATSQDTQNIIRFAQSMATGDIGAWVMESLVADEDNLMTKREIRDRYMVENELSSRLSDNALHKERMRIDKALDRKLAQAGLKCGGRRGYQCRFRETIEEEHSEPSNMLRL